MCPLIFFVVYMGMFMDLSLSSCTCLEVIVRIDVFKNWPQVFNSSLHFKIPTNYINFLVIFTSTI